MNTTDASPTSGGGLSRRAILWIVVGVLALAGVVVGDRYKAGHRTLHVVNGYEQVVHVEIEGGPKQSVPALSRVELTLPEGDHKAKVTGPVAAQYSFSIRSGLIVRLFDSTVFVLNPGGAAILVREDTVYTAEKSAAAAAKGGYSVYYQAPFVAHGGISYPFQEFPATISTKSKGEIRKSRLFQFTDPPIHVFTSLLADKRVEEALRFAEWAIDGHPQGEALVASLSGMGHTPQHRDRVLKVLRERLARRPVNIELHRQYQQLAGNADRAALEAEYDGYLKAEPASSALLYLRGRLTTTLKGAASYFQRALVADAKNAYAHFALAYGHASRGEWAEARKACEEACALNPSQISFREELLDIRGALGEYDALEKDLSAPKDALSGRTVVRRVSLLGLRGKREEALKLCDDYKRSLGGADPAAAQMQGHLARSAALYALGDFAGLEKEADLVKNNELAAQKFEALVELGRVDEAEKMQPLEDLEPFDLLTLSIAWKLVGNEPKAAERRTQAAEAMKSGGDPDLVPAAQFLSAASAPALDDVLDVEAPPPQKAVLITALAQTFSDRKEYRERAAKLNTALGFPRHLLARALEKK